MEEKKYTPAQVCALFGISKSTLFRWEREGRITRPERGRRGERFYRRQEIVEIGRILFHQQVQQLARSETEPGVEQRMQELAEQISRMKFVAFGNKSGLFELDEMARNRGLSEETVRALLDEAARLGPAHEDFSVILQVIARTSKERQQGG
ncbi:MAG: MerR family DNA-binding transcriptional regulator [Anaerolineae bacterium]